MDFSKHLAKADEALRRRNYDFAVELYRQLLDLDPDLEDARRGLRSAVKKRHEAKSSSKLLRALGGALPLGKAQSLLKLGKHDAAARALEDYLAKSPLDVEANLLLGDALEQAGHRRSAKAVFEFIAEIAPTEPRGWKRAGVLMTAAGEHERALECFERALAIDPRDQEAIKARKNLAAETALASNRLDQVGHSREAVARPDEVAEQERARRRHRSPEELREDLERLEARFADAPKDVDLMLELASVHERLADPEAALEFAERAGQYRRDDAALEDRVAALKTKVLRRQLAAAGKSGDEAAADRLEGELFELERAALERKLSRRPGDTALLLELGALLLRAERYDDALAALQKAKADPRTAAELGYLKGRAFRAKGFADLAAKEFEGALAGLAPDHDRAKEIRYTLGALAEEQGDLERARSWFAAVFEVDIAYRDVAQKMDALR